MKFFFKGALFILIFLLFFAALEIKARRMYIREPGMLMKHNCLEKVKDKVEILFLGSSFLEEGVNPQYIEKKAFNIAYTADDIYHNYMIFKKYVYKMPRLKMIVLDISPLTFPYDEERNFPFLVSEYNSSLNISPRNTDIISKLRSVMKTSSILLIRQKAFFRDWMHGIGIEDLKPYILIDSDYVPDPPPKIECFLKNGYRYSCKDLSEKDIQKESHVLYSYYKSLTDTSPLDDTVDIDKSVVDDNINTIEKMIDLANKTKIKIVFTVSPLNRIFLNHIESSYMDLFSDKLQQIIDHHSEIKCYNFLRLNIFSDREYSDPAHLNYLGAKKYSKLLNTTLLKLF